MRNIQRSWIEKAQKGKKIFGIFIAITIAKVLSNESVLPLFGSLIGGIATIATSVLNNTATILANRLIVRTIAINAIASLTFGSILINFPYVS